MRGYNLRILYIGDIPIEHTYASRALLYRLLESHPAENLLVFEGALGAVASPYRLPGVIHRTVRTPFDRLCRTRLHVAARTSRFYYCEVIARMLCSSIKAFKPDVVLSVTFEQFWWAATRISELYGPKLVLSLQDDWLTTTPMLQTFRRKFQDRFASTLRNAHARLAISPSMQDAYRTEYGADSTLIYPLRPRQSDVFAEPKIGSLRNAKLFVGYAGSLILAGYPSCLVKLAAALDKIDGELFIYSDDFEARRRWPGLARPNVCFKGFVPNEELVSRLRTDVDVLISPASFFPEEKMNMEMLFPSKMTQYTAAGLPILVVGPHYSSLAQWARDNHGVAELVESEDQQPLLEALERLRNTQHRERLAVRAIEVGNKLFSYEQGIARFYKTIAT